MTRACSADSNQPAALQRAAVALYGRISGIQQNKELARSPATVLSIDLPPATGGGALVDDTSVWTDRVAGKFNLTIRP